MAICTVDDDCSGHGYCTDEQCNCDLGWFSSNCDESGQVEWGVFWISFRFIFAAVFLLLSLYTLKKLWSSMLRRRSLGCKIIILRIFRSPKNLSLCLILTASLLRGLWLCIDPLSFSGLLSHLTDRLLYDTVFPLMYCVYSCVLLVWSGLYHAVSSGKKDWSKGVRYLLIVLMVSAFVVSLTFSICQGLRVGEVKFIIPGVIFAIVATVGTLFGICFYGILLNKYIVRSESDANDDWEEVPRNVLAPPSGDKDGDETDHPTLIQTQSKQTVESDLALVRVQSVPVRTTLVNESPYDEPEGNTSPWSISDISIQRDEAMSTWSRLYSSAIHVTINNFSNLTPQLPVNEAKNYVVLMSWQDKLILRQIIILTTVSTVTGTVVIALTLIIAASELVHESKWALALLYVISAMEFFSYVVVLLIFSTEIKVRSKENLHFVSEIALRIAKNPGSLKLPPQFHAIERRLSKFVSPSK